VNIDQYISSGIVESYVLGLASAEERNEFEQLCLQYPELVAARDEFEKSLEKQAFQQAITPPQNLKERIFNKILQQDSDINEVKVVSMEERPASRWLRNIAAASVILLLASAYFAYDQYSENKRLKSSFSQLQSQVDSISIINEILVKEKRKSIDPDAAVVVSMVGTQPTPSSANIYWDTASSSVFLVVKNLPKLPSEKQYQLWAFIEGKPVDLGLFDPDNKNVILQMKNTQKAEAFAITIEKRGNGPIPQGPVETYGKASL
jgi:anti-sigma-K factor RskA